MSSGSAPAMRRPTAPASSPDRIFATSLVDVWWVNIPAKLRRYSLLLWAAWSDGTYLTAWPRVAVVIPIAVFLFGMIEGATHWTFVVLQSYGARWDIIYVGHGPYATVFAEILPLLVLAAFLAPLSANLGLMLATGYAIGDFLFFTPPWFRDGMIHRLLVLHVPQLICFVLFLLLSVWPVVATKFLVAGAHPRLRSQPDWAQALVSAAVLAAFVYEWTYFAPMLFRVAWVWQGSPSPFTVVFFHDFTMPLLVTATTAGVSLRYWLSYRAEQKAVPALQVRAIALGAQAQITPRIGAPWLRPILCAAYLTILIVGFLDSVGVGALIFVGMAAFSLARVYVLQQVWSRWSRIITHYPALLRLAVGVLGTYVITRIVLSLPGMGASQNGIPGKFGAEVLSLLLGFVLITLLLPNGVLTFEADSSTGESVRVPVSKGAVQVGVFIALMLLASKKALAQGICADPSCCFQGNNGAAAAATSAAAPSAAAGDPGSDSSNGTDGKGNPDSLLNRIAKRIGADKIHLPGGLTIHTDKPEVGVGGKVEVCPGTEVGGGVDVSPTEGHDPSGPIINIDSHVSVEVGGKTVVEVKDHATAGIDTSRPGLDGLSTSTHDQLGGIDDPTDPSLGQ